MGPRRSHTKSRKGCSQCKTRRIKCDELHPQCSNCVRREIECDFQSGEASTPRGGSLLTPSSSGPAEPVVDPFARPNLVSTKTTTDLDIGDLELLHHWTTVTYKTLLTDATSDEHRDIWKVKVVQLGFKHDFLMRALLATSAYHLSFVKPCMKDSYSIKASNHQSLALQSVQDILGQVDKYNCHAIFAFSCIIVVLTFATPRKEDNQVFQKEMLDWFHLLRGVNSVLQLQWETIAHSFMGPLLRAGLQNETISAHTVKDSEKITDLLRLCSSPNLLHERDASNAYALAIHELLKVYTQASIRKDRGQGVVASIFVWPNAIPQAYLALLGEGKPEAMIIMAHYSVLLKMLDNEWFVKGWARYLVTSIAESIGDEWQEWLMWPKEMVGTGEKGRSESR